MTTTDLLLIGRSAPLFAADIATNEMQLDLAVKQSRFLVLGGAGSIGQAVTKQIFKRNPLKLHVVDLSENNLVELVRDMRSSFGYIPGDFKTLALDIGSLEYDSFIHNDGQYDYVLNLSALKHVRAERDEYTLMRMMSTNILNTDKTLRQSIMNGCKKYFSVSTDKAANPVNLMGASKKIMEMSLMRHSDEIKISTARFANVAFSDGSLLQGFDRRMEKRQPLAAPNDIKRYFITLEESGLLCLMSCLLGNNREIFFPKLNASNNLLTFSEIAVNYLRNAGFEPYICESETEARRLAETLPKRRQWPCIFTKSETTGEKYIEEFFTPKEIVDFQRFSDIGVVINARNHDHQPIEHFLTGIEELRSKFSWTKNEITTLVEKVIPGFTHDEKGKFLDEKM